MDRTTMLGWEIKSVNGAFVSMCVLQHVSVQGDQGVGSIIGDILQLPSGQASCFVVVLRKDVAIRGPLKVFFLLYA